MSGPYRESTPEFAGHRLRISTVSYGGRVRFGLRAAWHALAKDREPAWAFIGLR